MVRSVLVLPGVMAFPALVVVLLVLVLRRTDPAPSPHDPAEVARRHALGTTIAAWLIGVVGMVVLSIVASLLVGDLGATGLLTTPLVFGLLYVATCGVGELTWPAPTGSVRRARLEPRRVGAPSWLSGIAAVWAAGLVAGFVALALATDRGYAFLWMTETRGRAVGPFPGWETGGPALGALALLALVTAVTLRAIAARPTVPGDPDADRRLRHLSAHRVLRGAQLAIGLALAELLTTVAEVLRTAQVHPAAGILTGVAVVVVLTALVAAAVPVRGALPPATAQGNPGPAPIGEPTAATPAPRASA